MSEKMCIITKIPRAIKLQKKMTSTIVTTIKNEHQLCFSVSQFAVSHVNCMNDYVKSCTRESDPGHIIFNVGTNDLPLDKDPNRMAQSN